MAPDACTSKILDRSENFMHFFQRLVLMGFGRREFIAWRLNFMNFFVMVLLSTNFTFHDPDGKTIKILDRKKFNPFLTRLALTGFHRRL